MPVPVRGTKANGTTSWAAGDTILAAEHNTDLDTIYTALDGSGSGGLDGSNFDLTPATPLSLAVLDDASTTAAAMKLTTDPGVSGSENLPTDILGEIKVIRYALEQLASGVDVTRVDGSGTVTGAWHDLPARGRNLVSSPRFPYKTSATATDPPNFWTKVGTPTGLALGTTDASEGGGNELQVIADAADEGVSQSIGFLKPSTRYLVIARLKVASGTAKLDTTGADATSDFRDVSITTTSASFTTVMGMVQTDATPTALLVRVLSSGAAATFDVSYVGCFECTEDFTFDDIAVPGLLSVNSDNSASAALYTNGGGWTAVPGGNVTITIPGPGYGMKIHGYASAEVNTGGGQLDVRITANIDGGGAAQVGETVAATFSAVNAQNTVHVFHAIESVTSGESYVIQVEGYAAANTLDANPATLASGDNLGSGLIVELVPTGA